MARERNQEPAVAVPTSYYKCKDDMALTDVQRGYGKIRQHFTLSSPYKRINSCTTIVGRRNVWVSSIAPGSVWPSTLWRAGLHVTHLTLSQACYVVECSDCYLSFAVRHLQSLHCHSSWPISVQGLKKRRVQADCWCKWISVTGCWCLSPPKKVYAWYTSISIHHQSICEWFLWISSGF
jgi:hypothetical protein